MNIRYTSVWSRSVKGREGGGVPRGRGLSAHLAPPGSWLLLGLPDAVGVPMSYPGCDVTLQLCRMSPAEETGGKVQGSSQVIPYQCMASTVISK